MKVIILDRKKAEILIILILLMFSLFGIGKIFQDKLGAVSLMQNDIDVLKEYKIYDNSVTYKLPDKWETKMKNFQGKEIVYHNDFKTKDFKINGFVQVWRLQNKNLREFLDDSKKISEEQNIIKNYEISPVKIKDMQGYLVKYDIKTGNNIYYTANEYFLIFDNEFIRFSFFVKEKDYKENVEALFYSIVNTINIE